MVQREQRISSGCGEVRRESTKKMKPSKAPQRGPGIAVLEMLRRDEPPSDLIVPSVPEFDSSSSIGHYFDNFSIPLHQLLDSSSLVTNSCPNSQLLAEAPRGMKLPLQLLMPREENQQQASQTMNYSSLDSVPGACLQMKLEPPSIQSRYGILNSSSWQDQSTTTHQVVGMKRAWPFQLDTSRNQRVPSLDLVHIPRPNCEALVIDGMPVKNTDCDGALSLHNVGGSLMTNHPTVERNFVQKKARESSGSNTSAAPLETQVFYNFMGLHHTEYVADSHMIADQIKRRLEGLDAVDVELKL